DRLRVCDHTGQPGARLVGVHEEVTAMPLSIDAVYRPFKAFFLEKYGGTATHFRFASVPHAVRGEDFVVAAHPEWGPSPELARERLSQIVDGIPTFEVDGRHVSIGPGLISAVYADELLAPAT